MQMYAIHDSQWKPIPGTILCEGCIFKDQEGTLKSAVVGRLKYPFIPGFQNLSLEQANGKTCVECGALCQNEMKC